MAEQAQPQAESRIEEMARYVRFESIDREALAKLYPHIKNRFAEVAERFYDRILEHEEAKAVFKTPAQIDRLRVTMQSWVDRLIRGPWDDAYYQLALKVGRAHVKSKLPQHFMFTAMAVIRNQLIEIIRSVFGDDVTRERQAVDAVCKVVDLDLAIMLESYRDEALETVRSLERMEREYLERRLEISEERYLAVVETAEVMVIAVDGAGRVKLFNQKAERTSEYRRTDVVGKDFAATLCHPADTGQFRSALTAVIESRSPPAFEARILTKNDDERTIRWHLTTLPTPEGVQACVIGLDVTEERSLELRTRRAERLASLGTLAAGLAHEIRNPLNAAQLQLTLAERRLGKEGAQSAPALKAIGVVHNELQRLSGLVEDFLAFARPMALRIEGVHIANTILEIVALLRPDAEQAGVELACDVPSTMGVRCDEERIKQVLLNLVRNGIEAAGDGGDVAVSLKREGQTVAVEVSDNGPGLPTEIDIFEPFATTKDQGTGLGLSIVHRIVTDHQGTISVDRRGDRTVFQMRIPVDGPLDSRPLR